MAELVSMRRHAVGSAGDYSLVAGGSGALSGAATGAALGSVVPVLGTTLGAVLGAVVGLLGGFGSDPMTHGAFTLAKRGAVAGGLVPSGKVGSELFANLLLTGDAKAVSLYQQTGGDLAKWRTGEQRRRAAHLPLPPTRPPPIMTGQPVGPQIFLGANVATSADVAPPGVAQLIALLQQLLATNTR